MIASLRTTFSIWFTFVLTLLLQSSNAVTPEIGQDSGPYCGVSLRGATRREAVAAQCARLRDAVRALLALYCRTKLLDFQLTDTHYLTPSNIASEYTIT